MVLKKLSCVVVILLSLLLLNACGGSDKGKDLSKGRVEKMTDDIAQKMADHIDKPLDAARKAGAALEAESRREADMIKGQD